jgi:hypothetical protein
MAKDEPQSGPVGNTDPSKRGRGTTPGGRPSKNQPQSPAGGGGKGRSKDDPDTDGYNVGGRGRKR